MTSLRLPEAVCAALHALERAGYPAYVVGGCVRDGLRGLPPHDWDVCTAARPAQVHRALGAAFSVRDTGLRHGTVTAVRDGLPIEITTYRVEGAYTDGRHPDAVRFVDRVEEDLARRDFTVGAMAYSPTRGLCDPFGGQRDLEAGVLRCVGDPDARFREDALRIARGMRLAAEHGFTVEPMTAAAMERQAPLLDRIAAERIAAELTRLLTGRYAGRALRAYRTVLGRMLPELVPMYDLPQQNRHHRYDVWEHTVRAVEQVPDAPLLRWAMLLHDCDKPASKSVDERGVGHFYGHPAVSKQLTMRIAARLRFSSAFTSDLLLLVEQHDRPLGDTEKAVRRRLAQIGETHFRALLAIKKGDCVGQDTNPRDLAALCRIACLLEGVLAQAQCFSLRQLAIDGNDMRAIGLHGSEIGRALGRALEHVLEHPRDNRKDILLALVRGRQTGGSLR